MAVDITLVDSGGNELKMPTGFNYFSEQIDPDYPNLPEEAWGDRNCLIVVMEIVGSGWL